ncbi:hypothetical protein JYQ62_12285 [Nostoc sp. UHCC 0702]|nr:hypothetical protein JYQ62_12285 [Nostoc sp. UHCC 0702]
MASLLVGVTSHTDITKIPTVHFESQVNSLQMFPELNNYTTANVAQASREIDEKTAFNLVWKLRQVQRKAREIERLSRGSIRVAAIVDGSPTPDEPYYTVRVFEKHPNENVTIYWFRVLHPSGTIQVLDLLKNEYVSLEKWKPD